MIRLALHLRMVSSQSLMTSPYTAKPRSPNQPQPQAYLPSKASKPNAAQESVDLTISEQSEVMRRLEASVEATVQKHGEEMRQQQEAT